MNQLPEQDLPPGRHRLLKEHLMTGIRHADEAVTEPRKRWLRPALTAAAVATVAAVAFTVLPSSGGADAGPRVTSAAALLEDVALAAEHRQGYGRIRDDQFVYVDTERTFFDTGPDGKPVSVPLYRKESWVSVDGTRKTLVRDGRDGSELSNPPAPRGQEIYGDFISYDFLKSLPTEPDSMYDYLLETPPRLLNFAHIDIPVLGVDDEYDEHQTVLQLAGRLLKGSIVPPGQSAALYRAVARIPGVTVVEDSVDARGRHGVGIARTDTRLPVRLEWTFDKTTYELLGQRSILTRDYRGLKKGTVISDTAVERRAVVDKAGRRP
ncbi:CU044_5270 family protein [Streptomyces sp. IBSBF 2953]|uniref:CU044_5270 family protein n=1 Tax=Streptomyces TaxID=1883 RepID=UPI00211A6D44|nr:CU044_5270 family protein [Streptomyces scabiei]MCQ9183652.1 CU044_5270 family protein [Streptomyces hayashii]MDX3119097.1 CU044_5270 family protein [Streptomyces scabiei]